MQRYVSNELFHCVGRGLTEEDQYSCLKEILTSLKLSRGETDISFTQIDQSKRLSSNEVYDSNIVCFCDIPLNDLEIHIKKYSCFALSFLKSYLVIRGASPVWYISEKSKLDAESKNEISGYHDEMYYKFSEFYDESESGDKARSLWHYLNSRVFPFMKFFDADRGEADEKNYYMEREWRVVGAVDFKSLDNIHRIILPKSFARRFREDFAAYLGQISYI